MKVCIDPGHQACPDVMLEPVAPGSSVLKPRTSAGTFGIRTGATEHAIALSVALMLESALASLECEVVLTRRSEDVNLSNVERARLANLSGAAFCLKIHCNGVRNILRHVAFWKRGSMTLIPVNEGHTRSIYQASLLTAGILHKRMLKATRFPDLGIHTRSDLTGFNWSEIPVVLLELGYLTNPKEEYFLANKTFQENLSLILSEGVLEACRCLLDVGDDRRRLNPDVELQT